MAAKEVSCCLRLKSYQTGSVKWYQPHTAAVYVAPQGAPYTESGQTGRVRVNDVVRPGVVTGIL